MLTESVESGIPAHRRRFQGIQFLNELVPSLRVPLRGERLFKIGVIGEKILPQNFRERLAARFVQQLGVSFISESIGPCFGDCARIKVIVW